jgi:hypothetical protein
MEIAPRAQGVLMRGIGKMGIKRSCQFGIGILLCTVLVLSGVLMAAEVVKPAEPSQGRADVIVIDGLKAFGALERPAVMFYHDKHTEALAKQNKDCSACHETVKGKLSLKFKRIQDKDKETVMDTYHDQCISCHNKSGTAENPAGPVTCGECHVKDKPVQSTWAPIELDKSLHYRHVKANDKKCENCHHAYNDKTKSLYYAKGEEGACVYCHKEQTEDNRISDRLASHEACVGCHKKLTAKGRDAGPIQCSGCHDPRQQALIEKVANVPRMERHQPDAVLVKTGLKSDSNDPAAAGRMAPVPFDHKAHEGYNDTCRQCHHAALTSCSECHTIQGAKEGQQVKLAQAMHDKDSKSSCIGCHKQQQADPKCAGCHSSITEMRVLANEDSCKTCHMASPAGGPYPAEGSEQSKALAAELVNARTQSAQPAAGMITMDQAPETVTIKVLADEYESATFPHRKMIEKLAQGLQDNRLAASFHNGTATLCQGCHHHSPASAKPPQCGSCHGRSSEALNLTRPGLKAAYHQQCLQCHDKMGLEKPASRDCTACHAKRK